jgi:hypothetical protein
VQHFDIVMTGCCKPGFFSGRNLLFAVNPDDAALYNTDNGAPILQIDKADVPSPMPASTIPTRGSVRFSASVFSCI